MNYVTQLCEDLELDPNLAKSESGFYLLPLAPQLQIEIGSLDPGAILHAVIAPCPKMRLEEFFTYLMKANLFGQGTLGSIIGLDTKQKHLTLLKKMPYDMTSRVFRESVEDFANIIEFWREEVQRHNEQGGIL